jgi:predicted phosphodiesterase
MTFLCMSGWLVLPADARNLTFFTTADTHFGYQSGESQNIANIQAMNSIAAIYGAPRGILVAGDLTDKGKSSQWNTFQSYYPLNGGTGANVIHYPVYECTGNHDRESISGDDSVPIGVNGVPSRHGSLTYSWDWDGVHFVSLDLWPNYARSNWLATDLASVTPKTPIVIMTHYGYDTEFSRDWWASDGEQDGEYWETRSAYFKNVISDHNVIALIHGHAHGTWTYQWEGYDCYTPGSPKTVGGHNSFGAVNITDNTLTWNEYYWTAEGAVSLAWTHTKTFAVPEPTPFTILATGAMVSVAFMFCRRLLSGGNRLRKREGAGGGCRQ